MHVCMHIFLVCMPGGSLALAFMSQTLLGSRGQEDKTGYGGHPFAGAHPSHLFRFRAQGLGAFS